MKFISLFLLFAGIANALLAGWDASVDNFPRRSGESDDASRIQRAIDSQPGGVVWVPSGIYEMAKSLVITNLCSVEMSQGAVLRAVREMPFVVTIDASAAWKGRKMADQTHYTASVVGGTIDGNGLASCMLLDGFRHFTLRDTVFLNGRQYGLHVGSHSYELMANNLYFKCVKSGLAGNTVVYTTGGDSHYTDCVVVDYTVGFLLRYGGGGDNRLTRCHVWGGPLPPRKPGEPPEMLKDSVCYWIHGASGALLRDCYADTGKTGFLIDGKEAQLDGCRYFNNSIFKLDGIKIIDHRYGRLHVSGCKFCKNSPNVKVYDGIGTVIWNNIMYDGFDEKDDQPGAIGRQMTQKKEK